MSRKIIEKVKLHNEFKFVLTDAETGKIKQEATAYNLITDKAFERIGQLYTYVTSSDMGPFDHSYGCFAYIFLGNGTGTLAATRTSLFGYLGEALTSFHDNSYDLPNMSCAHTRKAVFDETMLVGETITEVGYAYDRLTDDANGLTSHALIEDSEGTPISVVKGSNDILTVYATTYFQVIQPADANVKFIKQGTSNALLYHWGENASVWYNAYETLYIGYSDDAIDQVNDNQVKSQILKKTVNPTWSTANKTLTYSYRFGADEGNHASGIREIGLRMSFDEPSYEDKPFLRSVMPVSGTWTGTTITDEPVGTGDGATTVFNLDWTDITAASDTIKVDGVVKTRGTDYTIDNVTGAITFTAAPATDAAITATYDVTYIPKDVNHVLDIEIGLVFADANAA